MNITNENIQKQEEPKPKNKYKRSNINKSSKPPLSVKVDLGGLKKHDKNDNKLAPPEYSPPV